MARIFLGTIKEIEFSSDSSIKEIMGETKHIIDGSIVNFRVNFTHKFQNTHDIIHEKSFIWT